MAKELKKEQISIEDLQKKLDEANREKEELRAKLVEGEEGALKRVAKAMNLDPTEVTDKETTAVEMMVEVEMGHHEVNINGNVYRGTVEVPHSVAQVLHQAIGDRRMRLIREVTGNDYVMQDLAGGGLRSRVVGKVNVYGEKV